MILPQAKHILVTGGAGYIGSHTTRTLLKRGYDVTVVDDLSRGYRHNVAPERLRVLSTADTEGHIALMGEKPVDAVIHFAAYIAVGESMVAPEIYFGNNVGGSLSLFTAMLRAGVRRLVFSSTAAAHGMPSVEPDHGGVSVHAPINPYGESKVMVRRDSQLVRFHPKNYAASVCAISTLRGQSRTGSWARSTSPRRT